MCTHQRTLHQNQKSAMYVKIVPKGFDTPAHELKRHRRIHTGEVQTYSSYLARKSFTSVSNMHTHQRKFHPAAKHYVCQDCAKGFDTSPINLSAINVFMQEKGYRYSSSLQENLFLPKVISINISVCKHHSS